MFGSYELYYNIDCVDLFSGANCGFSEFKISVIPLRIVSTKLMWHQCSAIFVSSVDASLMAVFRLFLATCALWVAYARSAATVTFLSCELTSVQVDCVSLTAVFTLDMSMLNQDSNFTSPICQAL